jgi:hypothetical protein
MLVVVKNTTAADNAPPPPTRPDGSLWPLQMIYDDGWRRAFGDTTADLVGALADGYDTMGDTQRAETRRRVAENARTRLIVKMMVGSRWVFLDDTQKQTLSGRNVPLPAEWHHELPIVVVGDPGSAPSGNVVVIDPTDDTTLVESLAAAGVVGLYRLRPADS